MKIELNPQLTMEQLQTESGIVAIEAFAGTESLGKAVARLPAIFGSAKAFYAKYLGNLGAFYFKTKELRDISSKLEQVSYVDIRNIDVLVPEGMVVDLPQYVQTLNQAGATAQKLESDVLKPFETWLAQMLGDPENLRNLTQNLKIPAMRLHDTKAAEKQIQACFAHTGRREGLVKYSQAFRRNSDVGVVAEELEQLEANFGMDGQKRIVQYTDRITMMMGELITLINGNPEKASPAAVRNLSDITFQVARELEHYGLLRYRITELSNSMGETMKSINRYLSYHKFK